MLEWILYPLAGGVVGILAGLLGVGGGIVIVPILVFLFSGKGFPPQYIMQLALATSLGCILFTSVASFWTHHRHGAVRWDIFRRITLGSSHRHFFRDVHSRLALNPSLKVFFALFLYYVAAQMLSNFKPKPSRQLPGRPA